MSVFPLPLSPPSRVKASRVAVAAVSEKNKYNKIAYLFAFPTKVTTKEEAEKKSKAQERHTCAAVYGCVLVCAFVSANVAVCACKSSA